MSAASLVPQRLLGTFAFEIESTAWAGVAIVEGSQEPVILSVSAVSSRCSVGAV